MSPSSGQYMTMTSGTARSSVSITGACIADLLPLSSQLKGLKNCQTIPTRHTLMCYANGDPPLLIIYTRLTAYTPHGRVRSRAGLFW
jgi:hypothetical protein